MSKNKRTETQLLNQRTYRIIYTHLKNISLSRFEWSGLPEPLKGSYIEDALYAHGKCLFFKDPDFGYMSLPYSDNGEYNVYNEAVRFRAFGRNYNTEYNVENAVRIDNNPDKIASDDYVMVYTERLFQCDRAIDVNIRAQKTPLIIRCDNKELLTLKNMYEQVDGNMPAIFADKSLDLSNMMVLETKAPFVADKIRLEKHEIMNEILTFMGINNGNTDKKERLIVDEVNANNQYIKTNIELMLQEREKAAEEINHMFGLSVSVKINEKVLQALETEETDESVHSGAEDDNQQPA